MCYFGIACSYAFGNYFWRHITISPNCLMSKGFWIRLSNTCISGVGTMGTEEVHCTPVSSGLVPLYPQVKDAAYVKILSKPTLTTRLYKLSTNLYPPPHLRKRSDVPDVSACR